MHFHLQTLSATAAILGLAAAVPVNPRAFSVPTDDGFPNPSAAQLAAINTIADGQISNAPPPATLAQSSLTAFQLIAFNENFEVGFFSSLIDNITADMDGYRLAPKAKDNILSVLKTVKAQEELHAINALDVLNHFGAFAPLPCTYQFPTTDIQSAFALAATFTSFVLGTLQDASQLFATNGDAGPVRAVASVIGQEGQQDGWFRGLLDLKPSEKPFLTTSTAAFAFSALQGFVADCPFDVARSIDLPIFPALAVISGDGGADVAPQDQTLTFRADLGGNSGNHAAAAAAAAAGGDLEGLFITYLTGQNVPVSEPVTKGSSEGGVVTVEARFPFAENVMQGLSIAALTTRGDFASADDVPGATLAAPGLIQVNDRL